MNIGFIGLGKLGLPCAYAMASTGHNVKGYDVNENVQSYIKKKKTPYREEGLPDLMADHHVEFTSIEDVVTTSDIIFIAVQTPHKPELDGSLPLTDERADFDYQYLIQALQDVEAIAISNDVTPVVSIISTVLPGTIHHIQKQYLTDYLSICYNPYFIAMGTVLEDFFNPEFILLGGDNAEAKFALQQLYVEIFDQYAYQHNKIPHLANFINCSVVDAEMIKMCYNTFIGLKIVFANTIMELAEKVGGNCDVVSSALSNAQKRIMSPAYMRGGMGDGGSCHPRDQLALSYLANKLNFSYNIFETVMHAREEQTKWFCDLIEDKQKNTGLPIVILGQAFKANTNLVEGSPAKLLSALLNQRQIDHIVYDPIVNPKDKINWKKPAIYFIATEHREFVSLKAAKGSIVIDPWRCTDGKAKDVEYVQLGHSSFENVE